jgi:hypothetical protein
MFKNRILHFALLAAFAVLLAGCGEYEKLLKSRDYQAKYEMGVKYYEEGEYSRAGTLFDQVANIYRGHYQSRYGKILPGQELLWPARLHDGRVLFQ